MNVIDYMSAKSTVDEFNNKALELTRLKAAIDITCQYGKPCSLSLISDNYVYIDINIEVEEIDVHLDKRTGIVSRWASISFEEMSDFDETKASLLKELEELSKRYMK